MRVFILIVVCFIIKTVYLAVIYYYDNNIYYYITHDLFVTFGLLSRALRWTWLRPERGWSSRQSAPTWSVLEAADWAQPSPCCPCLRVSLPPHSTPVSFRWWRRCCQCCWTSNITTRLLKLLSHFCLLTLLHYWLFAVRLIWLHRVSFKWFHYTGFHKGPHQRIHTFISHVTWTRCYCVFVFRPCLSFFWAAVSSLIMCLCLVTSWPSVRMFVWCLFCLSVCLSVSLSVPGCLLVFLSLSVPLQADMRADSSEVMSRQE